MGFWNDENTKQLKDLIAGGVAPNEIADKLGTTPAAVKAKVRRMFQPGEAAQQDAEAQPQHGANDGPGHQAIRDRVAGETQEDPDELPDRTAPKGFRPVQMGKGMITDEGGWAVLKQDDGTYTVGPINPYDGKDLAACFTGRGMETGLTEAKALQVARKGQKLVNDNAKARTAQTGDAAPAKPAGPRRSRVTVTLELLQRKEGCTVKELAAAFHKEFGDGKETTARQAIYKVPAKHGLKPTNKGKVDGREGTVYSLPAGSVK